MGFSILDQSPFNIECKASLISAVISNHVYTRHIRGRPSALGPGHTAITCLAAPPELGVKRVRQASRLLQRPYPPYAVQR